MKKGILFASVFQCMVTLIFPASNICAKSIEIIHLSEMNLGTINVHPHGTVINFPLKPEVHVGKKDAFEIVYVKNDLVISAKYPRAVTNIFVYLHGRRFNLKLVQSDKDAMEIVSIRDPFDRKMEVIIDE